MGELTLEQFRTELQNRGFKGFDAADLDRYINWSIGELGRKLRSLWQEEEATFSLTAGTYTQVVGHNSNVPALEDLKSIKTLYVTSADREHKLDPMSEEEFWAYIQIDLADSSNWGEPYCYRHWNESIYVLAPPESDTTFRIEFWKRFPRLEAGQTSILHADYDEAILLGALVRCHTRANQYRLAIEARAELGQLLAELTTETEFMNDEDPVRVLPDDQWL